MQNIVELENVSFGYEEDSLILQDISLEIPEGKIVAIMGGSGSGKTTILKLMCGQLKPLSGKIKLLGRDITNISNRELLELRKQIGMMFQFGALFTDLSVYENVAFTLKEHTLLPKSIIDKIVAMKLNAVGLFGTEEMMPQELSGGMARRVALARAIALDPTFMLYDEPFTGLDPISLNVAAMLIHKLSRALNQTAILVTHDIATSLKMADLIYVVANKKVLAHGSSKEIENSTDPAVSQFIKGEVEGPFNYRYPTKLSYNNYLEE